jgi:hypothetical protein
VAYEKGEIPLTPFILDTSTNDREIPSGLLQGISEVGLLGYFVEIATIFNEGVGRIDMSEPQPSEADRLSMEEFHQDTLRRLDALANLTKRHLCQGRDSREPGKGLHILYHYTSMMLHRYIRHTEIGKLPISVYVRGAYEHARLILEVVQKRSNYNERDG